MLKKDNRNYNLVHPYEGLHNGSGEQGLHQFGLIHVDFDQFPISLFRLNGHPDTGDLPSLGPGLLPKRSDTSFRQDIRVDTGLL